MRWEGRLVSFDKRTLGPPFLIYFGILYLCTLGMLVNHTFSAGLEHST